MKIDRWCARARSVIDPRAMTILETTQKSTIGQKMIMAVTGTLLFGWTVLHMGGNLLVFAGADTMNRYGAALQGSPLVWAMRVGLLVLIGGHVRQAWLTFRASKHAEGRYAHARRYRSTTLSARGMRAGGVALAAFVVYHLLHIYGVAHPDFVAGDVYHNVVSGFRQPLVTAVYLVATIAFASHIRHGLFSAARTLGARAGDPLARFSLFAAVAIGIGFAAPCVAAVTGLLR